MTNVIKDNRSKIGCHQILNNTKCKPSLMMIISSHLESAYWKLRKSYPPDKSDIDMF